MGEYLGEFETEFENIKGVILGPRDNRLTKTEGRKSRDTVPLIQCLLQILLNKEVVIKVFARSITV
jgi:hypothetical protein